MVPQVDLSVVYDRVAVSATEVTCSADGQPDFEFRLTPDILAALRRNNFHVSE